MFGSSATAVRVFGVEKFKGLLVAGTFTVLAGYIVELCDSIIAGNLLGEAALAGVNLAAPIVSAISFLGGLLATGMATEYSLALGRLEHTRACQFFMQGLWSVLLLGSAFGLMIFLGRGAYLAFMGASGEMASQAYGYLTLIGPSAVFASLHAFLEALGYADGDSRLCAASYVAVFVVNVAVDLIGIRAGLGLKACAIGTVCADIAGTLVMCLHFLRKSNSCRCVSHFAWRDTVTIARASFGDSAAFLCDALLFLFVNKFVIMCFGDAWMPVIGVASALWGFAQLFNGVGVAIQPIVTVYYAEGNTKAIRRVMKSAIRAGVVEGLALAAFCLLFPRVPVALVGIDEPALVREAVFCVRAMSVGYVALAMAGLFNSYYMFVERSGLAGVVTFLCYLVFPIVCASAGALCGAHGMLLGLGFGPMAGVLAVSLFLLCGTSRELYPLLLSRAREAGLHIFNLTLDDRQIVDASRLVAGTMATAGLAVETASHAALLVEEAFELVKERAGTRRLLGEITLDLNGEAPVLTLRDDGEIFDITDADAAISSFRAFLVASVMEHHAGRVNLVTTGFNRNVFRF